MINFIVVNTVNSNAFYDFDLVSGKSFLRHRRCGQKDVWGQYKGQLYLPPYTEGVIPRLINAAGRPLQILVFGRGDYYANEVGPVVFSTHRARIVGALERERCLRVPCVGDGSNAKGQNWSVETILLAVDPEDEAYQRITTVKQLKQKIDWDYMLAFLQNEEGGVEIEGHIYPYLRIAGKELGAKEAIEKVARDIYVFEKKDLFGMRSSCHQLYKFLWKNLGRIKLAEVYRSLGETLRVAHLEFRKILKERGGLKAELEEIESKEALSVNAAKAASATSSQEEAKKKIYELEGSYLYELFGTETAASAKTAKMPETKVDVESVETIEPESAKQLTMESLASRGVSLSMAHGFYQEMTAGLLGKIKELKYGGAKEQSGPMLRSQQEVLSESAALADIFKERFVFFHQKFAEQYTTCIKYVKASDGNGNYYRHWFYAYVELFYLLRSAGYIYDCDRQQWTMVSVEKKIQDLVVGNCRGVVFDRAFPKALELLNQLRMQGRQYYRYVEYDNWPNATHNKLFSWVKESGSHPNCSSQKDQKEVNVWSNINNGAPLFFEGAGWPLFVEKESLFSRSKRNVL
ncbi:MAG: hypothetical protein HQK53_02420 [Oligoflexia bacterium]|nr:hypothetical protein [Oligoflexia bacterium]